MARKLSKAGGKRKIAAKKAVKETKNDSVVLVGTYREKQLGWIKKSGVYNYPVKVESDGRARTPSAPQDDDLAKLASKVKELWLYAGVKAKRHCFAAEFVGIQSKDEFLAANPTYATKVGKPKHAQYVVFKTKPFDYGPKLEGKIVVARAIDFASGRGQTKKVAAAIRQFHADGEFAPLAAYLPTDLAKVPRQQLRVCEAAVQLDCSSLVWTDQFVWSAFPCKRDAVDQLEYSVVCINEFARRNGVSRDRACDFLCQYKGLEHLVRFYDVESTMPLDLIVEDLGKVCRMNGGRL